MLAIYQLLAEITVIVSFALSIIMIPLYPLLNQPLKIVSIYLIVGGGIELLSQTMANNEINNLFFLHFYTIFELLIISKLFNLILKKQGGKINVNWILYISLLIIITNTAFLQGLEIYNSYSSTLVSMLVIFYSLYYFYLNLEKENDEENIQSDVLKWSIICFFIYHCTTLIVMYFSNLLLDFNHDLQVIIWGIRILIILITKLILLFFFTQLIITIYREQKHV